MITTNFWHMRIKDWNRIKLKLLGVALVNCNLTMNNHQQYSRVFAHFYQIKHFESCSKFHHRISYFWNSNSEFPFISSCVLAKSTGSVGFEASLVTFTLQEERKMLWHLKIDLKGTNIIQNCHYCKLQTNI